MSSGNTADIPPEKLGEMMLKMYGNPDDDIPYYAALGKLFTQCARVEASIHMLARKLSNLTEAKARVIFSGMRSKDIEERITQIMRLDEIEKGLCDRVAECFQQFSIISTERDKLAHRHVSYLDKHIHVNNLLTAKSENNAETHKFTLDDFRDMNRDCDLICVRLDTARRPEHFAKIKRDYLRAVQAFLQEAWHYKSPLQAKKQDKTRKRSRKHSRQRQSSPV